MLVVWDIVFSRTSFNENALSFMICLYLNWQLKFSASNFTSFHNNSWRILIYLCVFQIFDKNGKLLSKFGKRGKGDGEIWYPAGVAVDDDKNIYVADHGNHRIQVFGYYFKK